MVGLTAPEGGGGEFEEARSELCGGLVRTAHPSSDCFLCLRTCVWSCVVVMKEECGNIFVKSDSTVTFMQGFKSLMYRSELMV
jgi:hypothetical protein